MIGAHGGCTHAIGEQHKLFFDAVLHVAACTIQVFIQLLRAPNFCFQRGHHKTWIRFASEVLSLGHHAPPAAPTPAHRFMIELQEHARRLLGLLPLLACLFQRLGHNLFQQRVARHAEHILDMIGLAPRHQLFPAKARITAQHDFHFGPDRANPPHDALDLFSAPRRRIDIAPPQARAQHMLAGKHI